MSTLQSVLQAVLVTFILGIYGCLEADPFADDSAADTGERAPTPAPDNTPNDRPEVQPPADLIDPCQGLGTPNLYADSETDLVVGCTNGIGLWHSTDAGDSFIGAHPSGALYVFDIARTQAGEMLVCGHDYDADGVLLYSGQPGEDWKALLSYGNNASDLGTAYLSNCGAVAAGSDGQLVVSSLTTGDITWSEDGGTTWSKELRHWEDDNLDPDGYAFHYLFHLLGEDGIIYGAGGQITEPPMFFQPSDHAHASWWTLHSVPIDPTVQGEVWALATPDNGATWLAGGRDHSPIRRASGFFYRSVDGGDSWTALPLPESIDIVRAVAFADDALHGVAVGHRYPSIHGGFALVTEDGGASWVELGDDLPLLEAATVSGDTYWLAGDAYLSRGRF